MDKNLLENLSKITEEEKAILKNKKINENIYFKKNNIIDSDKLLKKGKLITIRPHTRFVHFPKHKHNYIEMIYMCKGSTIHIIDGTTITLKEKELLILNQHATQEILPCGETDIAINFIILPEFFDKYLTMINYEENFLKDFIIDCLTGKGSGIHFLHFEISNVLPIQNLVENLAFTIVNNIPNKRLTNQITMGLLFIHLTNQTSKVHIGGDNFDNEIILQVTAYIEENYRDGDLTTLANDLGYELTWLSKTIKKLTNKTFTELLQKKRLAQACYLLHHTQMSILDISLNVGYSNFSYFHRIFKNEYKKTPRQFRVSELN